MKQQKLAFSQKCKRYKKITLTGLQIPPPPPTPISFASRPLNEQHIQMSSSSSQEHTYYENYFQNTLNQIVCKFLSQIDDQIQWQILDLKQSDTGGEGADVQSVDAILKIKVDESQSAKLHEKISKLKRINNQEQNPKKNFTKKSKIIEPSQKRNKTAIHNMAGREDQFQNYKVKEINSDRQFLQQTSEKLNFMSSSHSNFQENQTSANHSQALRAHKIDGSASEEEEQKQIESQIKSQQIHNRSNNKFLIITIIFIGIVSIVITAYLKKSFVNNDRPSKKSPQSKADSNANYGGQTEMVYYFGNIQSRFPKKNYYVPISDQEEDLKLPLYVQILPKVDSPKDSLHPRNLSYLRPTIATLLTFHPIYLNDSSKKNVSNINLIDKQDKIAQYLKSLGNTDEQIMASLYTQLHKNPDSPLLLQSQYYYLSNKYINLHNISKNYQKPLCIVAYSSSSLYKKQQYKPFFQSLLNQNYSNYRLMYIDDASPDKYNNARIMNYLWQNYYYELGNIESTNLVFIRFDKQIGKTVGVGAVVRQLCADGEIVVEINSEDGFVGRQALKVISSVYDGGYQRIALGPKNKNLFNPSKPSQSNLKSDLKPLGPQKVNMVLRKNGSQVQKGDQGLQKNSKQMPAVVQGALRSRYVGNIWLAYSNYFQISPIIDNNMIQTATKDEQQNRSKSTLIKTSEEIVNNHQTTYKLNKKQVESTAKIENARNIADLCIKTYVVELHHKLPLKSILPVTSLSQHLPFQIQEYSYNLDQFLSLLELSGRFTNQKEKSSIGIAFSSANKKSGSQKARHFVEIQEPLCYSASQRVDTQKQACSSKIQQYARISLIRRDKLKQLNNLYEVQAEILEPDIIKDVQFQEFLRSLQVQIAKQCRI